MMRKKNSLLIISVIFSGLFVSCLDDFTERTYYSANITSFGFAAHDTCPNIEDYVFNINQLPDTGLIYNLDSLPFGRVVNSLYPTLTLQSTNGNILMNDSLWEDNDSIDFTSPAIFKNTSADGVYTRVYKISVNVHQVDPDSMVMSLKPGNYPIDAAINKTIHPTDSSFISFYALPGGGMSAYLSTDKGTKWLKQDFDANIPEDVNINSLCFFDSKYFVAGISGQLYTSTNGTSWMVTGDGTKIVTLFGQLRKKYIDEPDSLSLIGLAKNSAGNICFAKSTNGTVWTIGTEIDSDFPVSDYAYAKRTNISGVESYTIATGLNKDREFVSKVWFTENGLYWRAISKGTEVNRSLGQRRGASLFFYDNYLVCFGGIDPNGEYHKDLYVSPDKGIGWIKAPSGWTFYSMNAGLAYPTLYVEKKKVHDLDSEFIWIFGGIKENVPSSDIWYAHLNKMVFSRR